MNDDHKPSTAITVAIIGGIFALCGTVVGVVGALVVIGLVILALFCYRRQSK